MRFISCWLAAHPLSSSHSTSITRSQALGPRQHQPKCAVLACARPTPGLPRGRAQVVSAAGAVDHGQLVELSEKAFAKLPTSSVPARELVKKARPRPGRGQTHPRSQPLPPVR